MKLPATFTKDEWGQILVIGHRISLENLMAYHLEGESAEMLHARFPTLSLAQCQDAVQLYQQQPQAVEDYLQAGREATAPFRSLSAHRSQVLKNCD